MSSHSFTSNAEKTPATTKILRSICFLLFLIILYQKVRTPICLTVSCFFKRFTSSKSCPLRMSSLSRVSTMVVILLILSIAVSLPYTYDHSTPEEQENCSTRRIVTKCGVLCGKVKDLVVKQHGGSNYQFLRPVEQYLGIPYASPPVGELRFMPPGSAPKWSGTKMATRFGKVCPQKFPNKIQMRPERRKHFEELRKYLQQEQQSEDCLYLNVYAPFQGKNSFKVRR